MVQRFRWLVSHTNGGWHGGFSARTAGIGKASHEGHRGHRGGIEELRLETYPRYGQHGLLAGNGQVLAIDQPLNTVLKACFTEID
jgi:hypothetical protein